MSKTLMIVQDDDGRLRISLPENDVIWALGAVEAAQRLMVLDLFKSAKIPTTDPAPKPAEKEGDK